ncbi:MAG: hypothetical protein ABI675_19595 [Chitinophagaceae bacterium]
MTLATAISYCTRILYLLTPHSERIDVAGSIRRQKAELGDIELVCIPKKTFNQTDLFGGGEWLISPEFESAIGIMLDHVVKGNLSGRYMQFVVKGHVKVDLFMPVPEDYYRQLAIRTGSREYSNLVIAHAWKRLGWVGAGDHGLRRREDCQEYMSGDKPKWKLVNADGELPPVWQSEEEFFQWLGLTWLDPRYREIKESLNKNQ